MKSAIVEIYRTDVDAMPAALAFTRFLVESHRHPNALHVAVEDLVTRNDQVIDALGQHLDIDLAPHAAGWDRKIGCYHDKLKMAQSWYSGHQSSNLFDGRLDSRVTLKPHAAWDAILPIFDRYHRRAEPAETAEIDADLERLDSLATLGPVPLRDLYDEIDTATRKLPKARKYLYSAYRKAPALVRPLTRLAR